MRNRVTTLLGIRYPIIQGGLAHIANGEFAAAVSNAGALGQITATSLPNPMDLRHEVERARQLTSRPFAVNLAIGHRPLEPFLEIALDLKPMAISLTGGNPAPYIRRIKDSGVLAMVLVAGVRQAQKAEQLGADVVIAVGYEGGGHLGRDDVGTLVLTRKVAESVSVPVIASGGIGDGHGLLATMALGAEGIEMGTRFLATRECPVHDNYKRALLESQESQTCIIGKAIGSPGRVLARGFSDEILRQEQSGVPVEEILPLLSGDRNRKGAIDGQLEQGYVWAGQGVGLIHDTPFVSELVERIMHEAKTVYQDLEGFWESSCG